MSSLALGLALALLASLALNGAFLLQHRDRRMWTVEQKLPGDSQPDDPGPDDDVLLCHDYLSARARKAGIAEVSIARQSRSGGMPVAAHRSCPSTL